jgi:3-oxoacyl-[acyl-carrier-protein] synthase II
MHVERSMTRRRVVVTGIGLVTPFGTGTDTLWAALLHGASAVGPVTAFDASECSTSMAAEIRPGSFDPGRLLGDRKRLKLMGRHIQLGVGAAVLAMRDAGLAAGAIDGDRIGVFVGGNHDRTVFIEMYEFIMRLKDRNDPDEPDLTRLWEMAQLHYHPMSFLRTLPNGPAAHIAIEHQARGPNCTILTDGVGSALAIGDAARAVEYGEAEVMLAGGADSEVNPEAFLSWQLMGLLSGSRSASAASRPFDRRRDGIVLGEGAGMLVLEELEHACARGAAIYGEVLGYGTATDPGVLPAEDSTGDAIVRAMDAALRDAGRARESVGYVNAHGLSSPLLDRVEARAIRRFYSDETPPVSSIKGAIGYLNAAAGAVDLATCLLALRNGVLPPTIHLEDPDPECALHHVANVPRPAAIESALSISFSLGGEAVALLVGAVDG